MPVGGGDLYPRQVPPIKLVIPLRLCKEHRHWRPHDEGSWKVPDYVVMSSITTRIAFTTIASASGKLQSGKSILTSGNLAWSAPAPPPPPPPREKKKKKRIVALGFACIPAHRQKRTDLISTAFANPES